LIARYPKAKRLAAVKKFANVFIVGRPCRVPPGRELERKEEPEINKISGLAEEVCRS
jgi:hypothetical protein